MDPSPCPRFLFLSQPAPAENRKGKELMVLISEAGLWLGEDLRRPQFPPPPVLLTALTWAGMRMVTM